MAKNAKGSYVGKSASASSGGNTSAGVKFKTYPTASSIAPRPPSRPTTATPPPTPDYSNLPTPDLSNIWGQNTGIGGQMLTMQPGSSLGYYLNQMVPLLNQQQPTTQQQPSGDLTLAERAALADGITPERFRLANALMSSGGSGNGGGSSPGYSGGFAQTQTL